MSCSGFMEMMRRRQEAEEEFRKFRKRRRRNLKLSPEARALFMGWKPKE